MPMKAPVEGSAVDLSSHIPAEHQAFVERTLTSLGVPPLPADETSAQGQGVLGWLHSIARAHVDVALSHRPRLIANALGSPPEDVIAQAHQQGVLVAALAGRADHARRQVEAGVDIVVAQGYEAGGHTGEIATMVLLPEVVDAVGDRVPVLGAGGIGSGRQLAAALALGASGVWMGSAFLVAQEYGLGNGTAVRRALLAATSSDTVRSRIFSGKPARLVKSRWTQAWAEAGAPEPLPMPLQNLLVSEAHQRIAAADDPTVVSMPVGQIVGRMNETRSVAAIMADLVTEAAETVERLGALRS
jgi:NAD(P)H-dependent flavin oxidoreductase YrpB (nitropropane dioxygenase family)